MTKVMDPSLLRRGGARGGRGDEAPSPRGRPPLRSRRRPSSGRRGAARAAYLLLDLVAVPGDAPLLRRGVRGLGPPPRGGREILRREEHDEQDDAQDVAPGLLRLTLRHRARGRHEHRGVSVANAPRAREVCDERRGRGGENTRDVPTRPSRRAGRVHYAQMLTRKQSMIFAVR